MPAPRSTASHASVAFLRIPDFAQHAVAEQAQLKERLEKAVTAALPVLRADEWIVLDTSEGLAVVILANPRGALRFAWRAGADPVEPNGIARLALSTQHPIVADRYEALRATGSFILIDATTYDTVAAGMIS